MFVGSYAAMSRGETKKKETSPPINATSKDEEAFIQYGVSAGDVNDFDIYAYANTLGCRDFLKNANAEEEKAKH